MKKKKNANENTQVWRSGFRRRAQRAHSQPASRSLAKQSKLEQKPREWTSKEWNDNTNIYQNKKSKKRYKIKTNKPITRVERWVVGERVRLPRRHLAIHDSHQAQAKALRHLHQARLPTRAPPLPTHKVSYAQRATHQALHLFKQAKRTGTWNVTECAGRPMNGSWRRKSVTRGRGKQRKTSASKQQSAIERHLVQQSLAHCNLTQKN